MKRLPELILFINLTAAMVGCSKADESIDKRGRSLLVRESNIERGEAAGVISEAAPSIGGFQLTEAKGGETLSPEFLANIILISKISEDKIVFIGKNGKSWVAGPGDEGLELVEPVTTPPSGQLYTLPDGKFWIVSPDSIGRRKTEDDGSTGDPGVVKAQSFATTALPGDKSKMRVLYAGPTDLILHLDTHVVVLSVEGSKIVNNPFTVATMLPKLDASIVSAGKAANDSFWFAAGEKLILAEPKGIAYGWSGFRLPTNGHSGYEGLALWLDQNAKAPKGDVMMKDAGKYWSSGGGSIAAP